MRKAWIIPVSRTTQKRRNSIYGLDRLARFLPDITKKAFEKFGFAYSDVAEHWSEIVGEEIAKHSSPERIRWPRRSQPKQGTYQSGILTIRVDGPRAIEIQHRGPEIIERINRFYGYQAISDIKIIQGPLPKRNIESPPIKEDVTPEISPVAGETLDQIENQDLKAALQKLGQGVKPPKK